MARRRRRTLKSRSIFMGRMWVVLSVNVWFDDDFAFTRAIESDR